MKIKSFLYIFYNNRRNEKKRINLQIISTTFKQIDIPISRNNIQYNFHQALQPSFHRPNAKFPLPLRVIKGKKKKKKDKPDSLHTFLDRYSIVKELHDRKETVVRLDFNAYTSFTCLIECDAEWHSMNNEHPGHRHMLCRATSAGNTLIKESWLLSSVSESNIFDARWQRFEDVSNFLFRMLRRFSRKWRLKNRGTTRLTTRSEYLCIFFTCADHVRGMIAIQNTIFLFLKVARFVESLRVK